MRKYRELATQEEREKILFVFKNHRNNTVPAIAKHTELTTWKVSQVINDYLGNLKIGFDEK